MPPHALAATPARSTTQTLFRPWTWATLCLLLLTCTLPVGAAELATAETEDDDLAFVRTWRQEHGAKILKDFSELLAIPNVARDTPNIRKNAQVIAADLAERGVEVELWTLDDAPEAPPVVYGALDVPGATRTLGIYVHYDGQPVDPEAWTTGDPWSASLWSGPVEEGGQPIDFPEPGEPIDPEWRIYARSAGDDKAPLPALNAALDALAAAGRQPTSNLRFLFEGEEEAGSPHLGRYLEAHREALSAVDAWLICDGPVHQSRRPQLVFGVRGYSGIDITVYGANRYLHSGHYGNWAPNPALLLSQLLASMKDDDGRVVIEGFYDATIPPNAADQAALDALPAYDDELRRELGLAATEAGNAPFAERVLLPSLNIRGMESAAVGAEARNVIPTQATATLDLRLAKGNDPEGILDTVEAHIRAQGYHIVREEPDQETRLAHARIARVERRPGYRAVRTPVDLPIAQVVTAAARRAGGEEPILQPTLGGSLPLYLFEDILGTPLVIVPMANHDNNQHAPDENLRIANLWYGIDLMGALLTQP